MWVIRLCGLYVVCMACIVAVCSLYGYMCVWWVMLPVMAICPVYGSYTLSDGYIVGCSRYMLCSGYMVDVVCPGVSFSLCGGGCVSVSLMWVWCVLTAGLLSSCALVVVAASRLLCGLRPVLPVTSLLCVRLRSCIAGQGMVIYGVSLSRTLCAASAGSLTARGRGVFSLLGGAGITLKNSPKIKKSSLLSHPHISSKQKDCGYPSHANKAASIQNNFGTQGYRSYTQRTST